MASSTAKRWPACVIAFAGIAILLGACGKKPSQGNSGDGSGSADTDAPGPLKLVVVLVIDQLPSWTFTRDAGQLEGGLGRLLRESVYFPDAVLPYANTYTAPGHAVIATGVGPRQNGILANGWHRGRGGAFVPATADPRYPVFDYSNIAMLKEPPKLERVGASSKALKAEGIADVLAREKPNSKSVALGLKQRAAILMLGRRPGRAIWYESKQRSMTTSAFYGEPPPWLATFNRDNPVAMRFKETWEVDDASFLRRYTGIDDDGRGEGAGMGMTTSFPHKVDESPTAAKAFRMMPSSVDYLLELAKVAVEGEQLGQRGERDLLAVTISSHDYVGHFWGQESWERFDMLRRIDGSLGQFLSYLDKTVGRNRYAVVLTSDHGAVPLVDLSVELGRKARRITIPEVIGAIAEGLQAVLGKGAWVAGYGANSIYLSEAFKAVDEKKQAEAIDAVLAKLRAIPNMRLAQRTAELTGDCSQKKDELRRVLCESIDLTETGDITVIPDRYSLFQAPGYTTGTSHGTPSLECRQVPILLRVPGVAPLRSSERVTTYQIAPTLAELLEIPAPSATEAKPLPRVADAVDEPHGP